MIGCSLGPGPWQCNQLLPSDSTLGSGAGSGAGSGSAAAVGPGPGSGSGSAAALLPAPSPPPPLPLPTKPPAAPPIATTPRREEPSPREPHGPKPTPSTRVVVADEVVMSSVRRLQPTFVACWKRAQRNDPTLLSARIKLTLDIGADGVVAASRTDAEDAKLSSCLAGVARKLAFPALGRAATVEVPLFF
jgi:hypothetical protein